MAEETVEATPGNAALFGYFESGRQESPKSHDHMPNEKDGVTEIEP